MPDFTVVEGRKSSLYNLFEEYKLSSCQVTNTRLMGALAMKIVWHKPEQTSSRLYQIIHLDYSEYGIDEYLEFECTPGDENYVQNKEEMNYYWEHFLNVMGGEAIKVRPAVMLRLIDSAMKLAGDDINREYDTEELRDFRHYALRRLGLMTSALEKEGIRAGDCSTLDAIEQTSVHELSTNATINYFLMRLADCDFEAAAYLSDYSAEELAESPLAAPGVQTLVRNTISKVSRRDDPKGDKSLRMYTCKLTTLSRSGYYHGSASIRLDGGRRDLSVVDFEIGDMLKLSDYESAMQLAQPEFITVFECKDEILDGFDGMLIAPLASSDLSAVGNGWLYTIYNKDNSHVDKAEYRLGDDVYGYALLTMGGELILMSHDLSRISILDEATFFSVYAPSISVKGRYRLDNPVFQTLCRTSGLYFDDLIEPEE